MDEYYRNEMNRLVKARNAIDIAIADFEWLKASQAHQRAKRASSTKIRKHKSPDPAAHSADSRRHLSNLGWNPSIHAM
jgi:hypothetical protein